MGETKLTIAVGCEPGGEECGGCRNTLHTDSIPGSHKVFCRVFDGELRNQRNELGLHDVTRHPSCLAAEAAAREVEAVHLRRELAIAKRALEMACDVVADVLCCPLEHISVAVDCIDEYGEDTCQTEGNKCFAKHYLTAARGGQ
jgi:hypothetical protein